jgi:hypothetical protein
MFQTKIVQKIKTHVWSITFSQKSRHLCDNVEEHWRAGQATNGNMAHEHYMLDTWIYEHTQNMWFVLLFHYNNGCMNTPQCCVKCAMPFLFSVIIVWAFCETEFLCLWYITDNFQYCSYFHLRRWLILAWNEKYLFNVLSWTIILSCVNNLSH